MFKWIRSQGWSKENLPIFPFCGVGNITPLLSRKRCWKHYKHFVSSPQNLKNAFVSKTIQFWGQNLLRR